MKKITILAVAALAISFASCRKDRVCECTDTDNGVTYVSKVTVKSTKKDAKIWCKAVDVTKTTVTANGISVSGFTTTTKCEIK